MKFNHFAAMLLALTMPFASCKKDKIDPPEEVQDYLVQKLQGACDNSLATVIDLVHEKLAEIPQLNGGFSGQAGGTCPSVSVSGQSFPLTVTLDFGSGCTTRSGHSMAGLVTVVASGKIDSAGSTLTLTFSNLSVDAYKLSGSASLQSTGHAGVADQKMTFSVSNLTLTNADGKTMSLTQLDGTRTQTAGQSSTPETNGQSAFDDDEFDLAFSGKGVDAEGKNFTLETTASLHRRYDCRYLVSGRVAYKSGLKTNALDYGSGACDNLVEVTVAGVTKTIELP